MDKTTHAAKIKHLARRLAAHEIGVSPFSDSIWAVFGVSSPPGRYCDQRTYTWCGPILEAAWCFHGEKGLHPLHIDEQPSVAAAKMRRAAVSRARGPKVALQQATMDALIGYLAERIALLDEIAEAIKAMPARLFQRQESPRRQDTKGVGPGCESR